MLLLFLLATASQALAGNVHGTVTDEDGSPVPFVTVYVEGTSLGTTTNADGKYQLPLTDGYHTVVFRYVGYRTEVRPVTVSGPTQVDVVLKRVVYELGEAQVDGSEDPAYRIMRLARSKRKFYQNQVRGFSCKVYVKGVNYVKNLPKRILGRSIDVSGLDDTRSGIVYLSESLSEFHFKAPDKTKERVIASKVSGNSQGFTWNNATSLNFNFYDKTYNLEGLSDRDLISPLSPSANLYYRYIYRGFYIEDSIIVNRIELMPRVSGVPLFKGHIFIQENTWRIHGADVYMTAESGIDFVDTVRMKVDFIPLAEDLWMKGNLSLDLTFNVKLFKVKGWGTFSSVFSDYNVRSYIRDTTLLNRYAEVEEPTDDESDVSPLPTGEVATAGSNSTEFDFERWDTGPMIKVESEANKKDEQFWQQIRSVPLTALEQKDYQRKDSIEVIKESKAYKDSIDRKNNRPALRNLLYGYTYRNSIKDYRVELQSPLTAVQYNTVEGYLIDHGIEFSKEYKDAGSRLAVSVNNRYGFYSNRYYAKGMVFYRFNRTNRMYIRGSAGHYVAQFNSSAISPLINSLYSVLLKENYMKLYQHTFGEAAWGVEAFNGFRVNARVYYGQRKELFNATDLDGTHVPYEQKYFSLNRPGNESTSVDDPAFGDNTALILNIGFIYQPGKKYMERPDGIIDLGSKWPEFRFDYSKGIGGFGALDADFDKLQLRVSDSHSFGMVGRFEWQVQGSWFANNRFVPFMDRQHFNTSRVHVMPGGIARYMALPYYAASTDRFAVQVHVEQHFNGFILNKIPLLKKLKWHVVGGIHYLYEPSYGNYWEVTAGIENIFQIIRVDFVAPFRERDVQQFAFRFQLGF